MKLWKGSIMRKKKEIGTRGEVDDIVLGEGEIVGGVSLSGGSWIVRAGTAPLRGGGSMDQLCWSDPDIDR